MFTCRPWVMSQHTAIRGAKSPSLTVLPLETLGFSPRQWGTIVHELQAAAPDKPLALRGNITRGRFLRRAKLEEGWTTEGRPGTTTAGERKPNQTDAKSWKEIQFPHHFWHSYGQCRNTLPDNRAKRSNGVENMPAVCHPIPRLLHQAA